METLVPTAPTLRNNPYVGPRTFQTDEAALFFGRTREARDLTALIVSQRLSLFYAPSGAGKSSLINTKIIPNLAGQEGFELLPVARVSGAAPTQTPDNIFIYNLITSLHQTKEITADFLHLTLTQFLDNLVQENGRYGYNEQYNYPPDASFKPRVLIIDQFEEILTTNTAYWTQREGFFRQIAEALAVDDLLWVVLTMREDFIAQLDPYLHHLPNRLAYRYYMERLRRDAALDAIKLPAQAAGRPFSPGAAEILVDNLRRVSAAGEQEQYHLSEFVEPVQLQAVCFQMWQKLHHYQPTGSEITLEDVQNFADVDTALVNFYEDTISAVVAETAIPEPNLRNWFETELITDAGTRNMVFRGEETTGSLPTAVADTVRGHFILRQVVRPGGVWLELIHDRLVQPILDANQNWRLNQPLIRLAEQWRQAGRPPERLLEGRALENLTQSNWQALGPLVGEYVRASAAAVEAAAAAAAAEKEAARQRELEQQRALAQEQSLRVAEVTAANKRQRLLTAIALTLTVFAIIATAAAVTSAFTTLQRSRQLAAESTRSQENAIALSTGSVNLSTTSANNATLAADAIMRRVTAEAAQAVLAESLETQVAIIDILEMSPRFTLHTIQPGDSLASISQLYSVAPSDILAANNLTDPGFIETGQIMVLVIPIGGYVTPTPTLTPAGNLETPLPSPTNTPNLQEQLEIIRITQTAAAAEVDTNIQTGMNINPDAPNSNPYLENTLLGLDWVRFVFKVDGLNRDLSAAFEQYDPIVDAYAKQGVSILFVLNQETVWSNSPWDGGSWPDYAADFAQVAGQIAGRYASLDGRVAYEIWYEPDLTNNAAAIYIEPANYALLLESAAAAIAAESPRSPIVFGSLASSFTLGIRYVNSVQNNINGDLPVNAIGLHPYGSWGNFDPFYNQLFSSLDQVYSSYHSAFPDIPLWVTEIGVTSNTELSSKFYPAIAAYMLDVFFYTNQNFAREVPVVMWFAWSDFMRNAGIVTINGEPKGEIYAAFQEVLSGAVFSSPAAAAE